MTPAFRPNASFARAYVGKTVRAPKRPELSKKTKETPCHGVAKSGAISWPTSNENHGKSGGRGFWLPSG